MDRSSNRTGSGCLVASAVFVHLCSLNFSECHPQVILPELESPVRVTTLWGGRVGTFSFLTRPLPPAPSAAQPFPLTSPPCEPSHTQAAAGHIPLPRALTFPVAPDMFLPLHTVPLPLALENSFLTQQHALFLAPVCAQAGFLSRNAHSHFIWRDVAYPSVSTHVTSSGMPSSTCRWSWWAPPGDPRTTCTGQGPDVEQA